MRKTSRKRGAYSANKSPPGAVRIFSVQIFPTVRQYWLSAITGGGRKKRKKKRKFCAIVRAMRNARPMTHPGDGASTRASRVCTRTYCVHLYVHTTGVSRYTLRHSDTAVPRKEFLAHARSMSVSVFWILIVSLRSRVRTIAMRRKGASTWSIILIAAWILISNGLTGLFIASLPLCSYRLSALFYQTFLTSGCEKKEPAILSDIFLNNNARSWAT